jgi:hypothetical protein
MVRVFISYSQKDAGFVRQLANDLKAFGVHIWVDYIELRVGDSLLARIHEGINEAQYFAVVISENSINSNWVQHELEAAVNREITIKKIVVLPLVLGRCPVPSFLEGKYYAEFTDRSSYLVGLAKVLTRLDADFEPAPLPYGNTYTNTKHDAFHQRLENIYNGIALKLMEWSAEWSAGVSHGLAPEFWGRRDDGLTYAFDTGDKELWDALTKELDEFSERNAAIMQFLTPRGIVMREAVRLFKEAANLGDPEAMWNLGWRYELGEGVAANHKKAVSLWVQAAAWGHPASKQKLSEMGYEQGGE